MRLMLIALLVPAVALAQARPQPAKAKAAPAARTIDPDEDAEQAEDEGEGEEDVGGGPPEGQVKVARPAPSGAPSGAGTQHTVEKGDTLWDLTQKYLGSPWYWPKVWSYNPEIANPHWIYPGNLVRFYGGGEEVPTQVELGAPEELAGAEPIDEDRVQVGGKMTFEPKAALLFRVGGFATQKEIEESGAIVGSFEQAEFLSSNMNVYLKFKSSPSVKIGDRFVVFKPGKLIYHPKTDDKFGYLTMLTGVARVIRTEGPLVTARITDAFDLIERGDLVAPYSEALSKRVAPKPNDRKLDGTIVATVGIGTYATMVIDQGSDQGVQVGNTFTVLRQQDGLSHETINHPDFHDDRYPIEEVGSCIAWEVKTHATSCVLTRAMREIVVGDWVQMKTGGGPQGARASR